MIISSMKDPGKSRTARYPRGMIYLLAGLAFLWAGLAGQVPRVWAGGGITVTSAADTQANDGQCTLREAITNANNDDHSGSPDCAAGGGGAGGTARPPTSGGMPPGRSAESGNAIVAAPTPSAGDCIPGEGPRPEFTGGFWRFAGSGEG